MKNSEGLKIKDNISLFIWGIKTGWELSRTMFFLWTVLSVTSAVIPLITMKLTAIIIDKISGTAFLSSFNSLLIYLMFFGIVYIVEQLYWLFSSTVNNFMMIKYSPVLYEKYFMKVQKLNLRTMEKADYQEKSSKINETIDMITYFVMSSINFLTFSITLIGLMFMAVSVRWYFGLISLIILSIRFSLVPQILKNSLNYWEEIKKIKRKSGYYYSLSTDYNKAKEIRMLSMSKFILERWFEYEKHVKQKKDEMDDRHRFLDAVCSVIDNLFVLTIMIISAYLLKNHQITIGTMSLLTSITYNLLGKINSANGSLKEIVRHIANLKIHKELDDLCDNEAENPIIRKSDGHKNYQKKINRSNYIFETSKLDFSYNIDDNSKKVIDNLNIKFEKGKIIALCGDNGSGKTTLIKILLGLYRPDDGLLKYKGYKYEELDRNDLNREIGITMQNYSVYPYSFRDNIAFSLINEINNDDLIWEAADNGGVSDLIKTISKKGLDQNLIKWVNDDAVEPSWGQKQKLAVARAHMGNKEVLILDEPASQLDPIAEYKQFMKVKTVAKDRTAILISHRIGFARLADQIIVLNKGKVIEQGTHNELINMRGKYYEMFTSQAQWYKKVDIDNYCGEMA
ncbi:MAG: hypothetical protein BGN88_09795 [Clostridiales bacterium 43-6]|nr:MAG: hypothetical protein BGN88_09795 [Clostridiales bacterium 43-6]